MMSVTPDPKTIIIIRRMSDEPDCNVCKDTAPKPECDQKELIINKPRNTSVDFACPHPQELFSVEINREIGTNIRLWPFDIYVFQKNIVLHIGILTSASRPL